MKNKITQMLLLLGLLLLLLHLVKVRGQKFRDDIVVKCCERDLNHSSVCICVHV